MNSSCALQLDALLARPVDVRKGGLLFPAGTRLLAYQRDQPAPRPRLRPRRRAEPVTAVRFSVLQAGLPPQTESLIYTDLLRQGALSKLGGMREERGPLALGHLSHFGLGLFAPAEGGLAPLRKERADCFR